MKIIFFGTPVFAIPSFEALHFSDHEIVSVVTIKDKKQGRGMISKASPIKKYANALGYEIIEAEEFNDKNFISRLRSYNADLFIVIAFKLLPKSVFSIPRFGTFNLHASLLPNYRGADPIRHALLNNDSITGVTAFQIEEDIDTGPIILYKKCNINKNDNYDSLSRKLSNLSSVVLIEMVENFETLYSSKAIQDQSNDSKSKASKINIAESFIDWGHNDGQYIINKMRAFTPKPGLKTFYNGKRLIFKKIEHILIEHSNLSPGAIEKIEDRIFVGTISGSIEISEIQFDNKKQINANSFWNGYCASTNKRYFTTDA